MQGNDQIPSESMTSSSATAIRQRGSGWLRLSALAAASALAGGLAAAWYYRKTLNALHQADSIEPPPEFGNGGEHVEEDA
jgi:hypothetical protein